MSTGDPTRVLWWLVSRASGIVALALISVSVLLGLAMAAKLLSPRVKRSAVRLHEYLAMTSLFAIGLHGAALLGDSWLRPGLRGIAVPFALSYRPAFTGIGIIAGYLALLLGPSFYLRRRIGARRWRKVHRATALVWVMSVVHTLGAGSDRSTLWLRVVVLAPAAPIVYALVMRLLVGARAPAERRPAAERAAEGHPAAERPAERRPAAERAAEGHPAAERAAERRPAHEKAAAERRPAHEKAAAERHARERRGHLEPAWGDHAAH